ncbi:MAG: hypothetical protein HYT21_01210 [Candidatus Nealsonbacteria bacterium]|nr:hypothetical protein [Candidatus Nealsonbacteria bacterium]
MQLLQLKRRNQLVLLAVAVLLLLGIVVLVMRFTGGQETRNGPVAVKILWINIILDKDGSVVEQQPVVTLDQNISCRITDFPIDLENQKDRAGNWNVNQAARAWQLEQERLYQEIYDSSQSEQPPKP